MQGKEDAINALSYKIIGAAIELHRELGSGLYESAYEACLCKELSMRGLNFRQQVDVPVIYKGAPLDAGYRLDLVVEDAVIVELKAAERILPRHEVQLLTYLRFMNLWLGLILNFHEPVMTKGITRVVNGKIPD